MEPSRVMDAALGCMEFEALGRRGRKAAMTEDERRRKAIDAAERIFLARGFHGSTMAEVACAAGMSKKTIYQLFASKDEVLEAVLARRLASLTHRVDEADDDRPVEQVLCCLLRKIVRFVFTPEELAFTRLLIADSMQSDEVVDVAIEKGTFIGRTTLAQWLARQASRGVLRIGDANEGAEMLVGMALGELHVRSLMKTISPVSDAVVEQRVTRAVNLFLRATQPVHTGAAGSSMATV